MRNKEKEAVIIVDYQKGFADKQVNELYVNGGETLAPIINEVTREVKSKGGIILASKDMHRLGNVSFAQNFKGKVALTDALKAGKTPGPENFITLSEVEHWTEESNGLEDSAGFTVSELKAYLSTQKNYTMALWPAHCVVNTPGSEYQDGLDKSLIDIEIIKGYQNNTHPYSAYPGIELGTKREVIDVLDEEGIIKVKVTGLAADWCAGDTAIDIAKVGRFVVEFIKKASKAVTPADEVEYLMNMRNSGVIIVE
ncbi:MAG: isochorismatase family protein [Candidatus Gracilibacteria bacterium]|nr:isochorismatase family protein [Candidatus Gracilibacteria bacterium]